MNYLNKLINIFIKPKFNLSKIYKSMISENKSTIILLQLKSQILINKFLKVKKKLQLVVLSFNIVLILNQYMNLLKMTQLIHWKI